MTLRFVLAALIVLMAGCSKEPGAPIVVTDVVVSSPASGMPMAAGYLEIENRSGAPILITAVTSPNYESVEMHETTVEDGVARMRELPALEIADGENVTFERGGKHLMLMRPVGETETVTLNFYSEDTLLVTVDAKFASAAQ